MESGKVPGDAVGSQQEDFDVMMQWRYQQSTSYRVVPVKVPFYPFP